MKPLKVWDLWIFQLISWFSDMILTYLSHSDKGVPNFWLTAMKTDEILSDEVIVNLFLPLDFTRDFVLSCFNYRSWIVMKELSST